MRVVGPEEPVLRFCMAGMLLLIAAHPVSSMTIATDPENCVVVASLPATVLGEDPLEPFVAPDPSTGYTDIGPPGLSQNWSGDGVWDLPREDVQHLPADEEEKNILRATEPPLFALVGSMLTLLALPRYHHRRRSSGERRS